MLLCECSMTYLLDLMRRRRRHSGLVDALQQPIDSATPQPSVPRHVLRLPFGDAGNLEILAQTVQPSLPRSPALSCTLNSAVK